MVRQGSAALTTFNTKNGLPDDDVIALASDRVGGLWVGTWKGVTRLEVSTGTTPDAEQAKLTDDLSRSGLPRGPVTAPHVDSSGAIWMATPVGLSGFDRSGAGFAAAH